MSNGLDAGDALRLSDKFRFFRGYNTDKSPGERDVPFSDLVTLLNDSTVLTNVVSSDTTARLETLENNLAINTLNDVIVEGRTVFNMEDQFSDAFWDQTGVDTGTSTNESYDAAGDYYSPAGAAAANMLLSCDGSDGATSFPDDVGTHTVTANGDAQVDTAQSKFGGASALFDGTGDYLSVPDSADWNLGTGDFTIDMWIRPTTVTGIQCLIGQTGGTYSHMFAMNGSNLLFNWGPSFTNVSTTTTPLTAGVWQHVAAVRNGNDLHIFVDGNLEVTGDVTGVTIPDGDSTLTLGQAFGGTSYNYAGHIDEVRYLKGTAVWTTSFTAPTSAYSLSPDNMVLVSNSVTADTAPTNGRLVVLFDPIDAVTLNTDLVCEFSRDGGSTWATATLSYDLDYDANIRILTTGDIDLSGTTSGTSIVVRATTANNKELRIHGWTVQWR